MKTTGSPIIAALVIAALASCDSAPGTRPINITVKDAAGVQCYFDRFENNLPYHVDSVKLDNSGAGTLHIPRLPLDYYRISIGNEQLIVVLDSTESLDLQGTVGALSTPEKLEGSAHTDLLRRFQEEVEGYDMKVAALRTSLAADPSNTANMDELNSTNSAFYERCKQVARENSGSPVAISALSRLNIQQELELFKQVREGLRKSMPRSTFFTNFRDQVDRFEQEQLMVQMQEQEAKRLSNLLPVGGPAPEIVQQTPDGGTLALSSLRGKYVLIDFWASWCRPCRMENPNVKRVYERFKNHGFEIFGVSLDKDHTMWLKAIQDDGLPWKHVSDLGFWNNAAAQEYGVTGIPYTVLVDRDGNIVEKGMRAEQLEAKLTELLGR